MKNTNFQGLLEEPSHLLAFLTPPSSPCPLQVLGFLLLKQAKITLATGTLHLLYPCLNSLSFSLSLNVSLQRAPPAPTTSS